MKSNYEEKKQRKIENYERLADKNETLSDELVNESIDMVRQIPMGQPILVGHHSEKSHRGLLNRSDNKMRKGIEAEKKSEYYKNKAKAAINNNSISSDDPEAIKKLKEKIAGIESNREFMKAVNKQYKKLGQIDKIEVEGLTDEIKAELKHHMIRFDYYKLPYPAFSISNSGQNLRSAKLRLEKLIKQSIEITKKEMIEDVELIDNVDENRFQIFFPGKPSNEIRTLLKRNGFRWSPSIGCWQSYRHSHKIEIAKEIVNKYIIEK